MRKKCTICERKADSRGLCSKHYVSERKRTEPDFLEHTRKLKRQWRAKLRNNGLGITFWAIQVHGMEKATQIWRKFDCKCSLCGSKNRLEVHHIDHTGKTANPNNNIDNLQLLCEKCHGTIHGKEYQNKNGYYVWKGREKERKKELRKVYYEKYRDKILAYQKAKYWERKLTPAS